MFSRPLHQGVEWEILFPEYSFVPGCAQGHVSLGGTGMVLDLHEAWRPRLQNRGHNASLLELFQGFHGMRPVGESFA